MTQTIEGNRIAGSRGIYPVASTRSMQINPDGAERVSAPEHNIWRETPLRYIGYADEIGEAVEPFIGKAAVKGSYWVSAAYAVLDAFTTSRKAYHDAAYKSPLKRWKETLVEIGDAILFHVPATIFVPAFFIGRVREAANYVASKGIALADHSGTPQPWSGFINFLRMPLDKLAQLAHANPRRSAMLIKKAPWIAAFAGIVVIPVVGHPVDKAVNTLLDSTYRKWVGLKKKPAVQAPELPMLPQPPSLIKPPETFETLFK